ncbi:GNAT family N-acetyltransferase [Saccharomonospora piscinae]|uniref:GNAT family N-acetyltransferase n=1 Tax=Saccharomonospora piscinae TaxID=687388 RepID=UPI00046523CE|nr:GNAT family N-acetyltransferase [Saccharomonospora piscinae]
MIRPARGADLPRLREIERAAGHTFAAFGMSAIADDEPPTYEVLRDFLSTGTAWVAVDGDDHPVAYLLAEIVDGCAHIEQVSVHPSHAGRRIGRALIEHLARWAVTRDLPAITLTTFTDVPWNAPYYRRCGFHDLTDEDLKDLTPGLRRIRAAEAARGLDRWPRACLRREL